MLVQATKKVSYDPSRFVDVSTVDEAVKIILTPYGSEMDTQKRWVDEAPVLMSIIERYVAPRSLIIDYGCGVGRMAKPLINKLDCWVCGVDLSPNMRALADSLVASPRFFSLDPVAFDHMLGRTIRTRSFDAAIAVWALQHCLDPLSAIVNLASAMKAGGSLVLINTYRRFIPVEGGSWAEDNLDVDELVRKNGFETIERGDLPDSVAPGNVKAETYWAAYRRTREGS